MRLGPSQGRPPRGATAEVGRKRPGLSHGAQHDLAGSVGLQLIALVDLSEAQRAQVSVQVGSSPRTVDVRVRPAMRGGSRDAGRHAVSIRNECSDGVVAS